MTPSLLQRYIHFIAYTHSFVSDQRYIDYKYYDYNYEKKT